MQDECEFIRSSDLVSDYNSCMNNSSNKVALKELKYFCINTSLINKYNHLEQFKKS